MTAVRFDGSSIGVIAAVATVVVLEVFDASYPASFEGGLADADLNGKADLSTAAMFTIVNGASSGASYLDCVAVPAGGTLTFAVGSAIPNANVRPVVFIDANSNNAVDVNGAYVPTESWGLGGALLFLPPEATSGAHTATVFALSTKDNYFTDAGATVPSVKSPDESPIVTFAVG